MSTTTWIPIRHPRRVAYPRHRRQLRHQHGLVRRYVRGQRVRVAAAGAQAWVRLDARWVLAVVAGALLVAGTLLGAAAPASTESLSGATSVGSTGGAMMPVAVPLATGPTVAVRPGDTLWSIAARTFPEVDTREAIVAFREVNGSKLSDLRPGQRIVVPSRV